MNSSEVEPSIESATDRRTVTRYAALAALIYFVVACFLTPDYGPTWDIVIGTYPYGDRAVAWFESDQDDFVEFLAEHEPVEMRQPYLDLDGTHFFWYQLYPLGSILSGLSNRLIWDALGWLDPVIAHQIVTPILTTAFIFFLVYFLGRRISIVAGLSAAFLLMASPRFLSHSISNLKDVPECIFYSLAYMSAYRALQVRSGSSWIFAGVATALALAQKANTLFLPFQLLTLLLLAMLYKRNDLRLQVKGTAFALLSFLLCYLAVSPAFWHETVDRVLQHFGQVQRIGSSVEVDALFQMERTWMESYSAPWNALITTPIPILLLAAIAVFKGKRYSHLKLFLMIGALFPILRVQVTGTRDFDGIRHFMEFYPFVCGLAAMGVATVMDWIGDRPNASLWKLTLGTICLAPGIYASTAMHPYGTSYFNALVGGLGGAQDRQVPQATDYWAASYWEGQQWLSEHAEPNAALLVPIADHLVRTTAPLRLRSDISLMPSSIDECPGVLYVMFVTRRDKYEKLTNQLIETGQPAFKIDVQAGRILEIHRFEDLEAKQSVMELVAQDKELVKLQRNFRLWLRSDPTHAEALVPVIEALIGNHHQQAEELLRRALIWPTEAQATKMIEWIADLRSAN